MPKPVARYRRETPVQRFNRQMGGRAHMTARGPGPALSANPTSIVREMVHQGSPIVPSRVTRAYQRSLGVPTSGGSWSSSAGQRTAWQNTYDQLVNNYTQANNAQNAINITNQENEDKANDRPWWGDLLNATGIPGIIHDASGGPADFGRSLLGRAGDLLGRPIHTITGGLSALATQTDHQGFNIGDLMHSGAALAAGAFGGLEGKSHVGGGQVLEQFKNNPEFSLGAPLRAYQAANPGGYANFARLAGFGLEMGLDPLNWAGPGAPEILRETGEVATRDAADNVLRQIAGREAAATASNLPIAAHIDPNTLIHDVEEAVMDQWGRSVVDVTGGGAPGVRRFNDTLWPDVAASTGREAASRSLNSGLNDFVDVLLDEVNHGPGTYQMPDSLAVQLASHNSDIEQFGRELEQKLIRDGKLPVGASSDDILSLFRTGDIDRKYIQEIYDNVVSKYESHLDELHTSLRQATTNPTYRTLGIKIGGVDLPVRAIGRAFDYVGTRTAKFLPEIGNHLFEGTFPGRLSNLFTTARATAFRPLEEIHTELRNLMEGLSADGATRLSERFTEEEDKLLQYYLYNAGKKSGNAKIDNMVSMLRDRYTGIFDEARKFGIRPNNSAHQGDFVWMQLKGGTSAERQAFNDARSAAYKDGRVAGAGAFDEAGARNYGPKGTNLKPVDTASENLMLAYKAHQRDMANSLFLTDLVENYGVHSRTVMSDRAAQAAGLKLVNPERLNENFTRMLEDKGGAFYIPQSMSEVADKFKQITSWNTSEYDGLARAYTSVINKMKVLMTLPYPGFHIKNFMGDVAMGLLDGVGPREYGSVMSKWVARQAGKNPMFKIVEGWDMPFDELFEKFERNSAGGFFTSEGGMTRTASAGNVLQRFGTGTYDAARRASDTREAIPRFVHFQAAYKEEARALWERGVRDITKIDEQATRAAVWRVNYYKFDYNALMPFEQKMKALAFPFYTYMRKATPTLMMQMYNNPKYFSLLNRYMQYNDGSAADKFNRMNTPSWIRALGAGILTDGPDPTALTTDILPYGSLQLVNDALNPRELLRQGLSNLNPIAQFPIEAVTKQDLYTGQPMNDNLMDQVTNNIPLLSDINQEVVHVPGMAQPQGSTLMDDIHNGDIWNINRLNNRLTGLGLPFHQISQQQQLQQFNENKDQAIDNPITQFNRSQDRYTITPDENFQFTIGLRGGGPVAGPFRTVNDAISYAQSKLPGMGYQRPFVSPLQPPTQDDVNMMMGITR